MSDKPGLGIDAGGTTTRWALAREGGIVIAEGNAAGMTGVQLLSEHGRAALREALAELGAQVLRHDQPHAVCAGFTGLDQRAEDLAAMLAGALGLEASAVDLKSDIEVAYHDIFRPGEGYVVYAGTGTVSAFVDNQGTFHRAGGRGVMLDDAGGGFWIAREALRQVWRNEDLRPGAWQDSAMAAELFRHIGGSGWGATRAFFYGRERGEVGQLARAVAASAERDPAAMRLLEEAGRELARLAQALLARFGPRPVALCGRALLLHPAIERSFRAMLPGVEVRVRIAAAHHAAARIAARRGKEHP